VSNDMIAYRLRYSEPRLVDQAATAAQSRLLICAWVKTPNIFMADGVTLVIRFIY
jgi:hypothetical protein